MRRSTALVWVSIFFALIAPAAFAAEVLTNDAIVAMSKAGLGDDLILGKIKVSQCQFDLSTQSILRLKEEGVSQAVLKAMVETAAVPTPAPRSAEAAAQETQHAVGLFREGKVVEAAAAFDTLIAARPEDDELKIWKARALLEQARALKDRGASGYKGLVNNAYAILQPMGRRIPTNPDWNYAMATAFWLNERPTWAGRAAKTALELRPNFPEAQILLGDLAYDSDVDALKSPSGGPQAQTARLWAGATARREYEKALAMPALPAALQAEALYKVGKTSAELERNPRAAREAWERAVAADGGCRYGALAKGKLQGAP